MDHATRQNHIRDYGVMASNAALWSTHAQDEAQRRRYYAEDAEGPIAWVWWRLLSRYSETEAAAWACASRVYADDVDRHRAARDGQEPNPRTLLQQRPPGSRLAWGELLCAYLFMTVLVAALFAALASLGAVGGVTVALVWPPTQIAILAGLWWAARDGERRVR